MSWTGVNLWSWSYTNCIQWIQQWNKPNRGMFRHYQLVCLTVSSTERLSYAGLIGTFIFPIMILWNLINLFLALLLVAYTCTKNILKPNSFSQNYSIIENVCVIYHFLYFNQKIYSKNGISLLIWHITDLIIKYIQNLVYDIYNQMILSFTK